jgi:type IV secretory pathway TrbL component
MEPAFIDKFYQLFIQATTVGMVALSSWVAVAMVGIFAIRFFYVVAGFMEGRENMISIAVSHLVPVVLLSWLSVEWVTVNRMLAANAMELGQIASGNQGNVIALFKVSEIIVNGFRLVKSIWDYMAVLGSGPFAFAKNFWFIGWYLGSSVVIIVAQFYVAYIIFRSNIEYALHSLGTLAMLPFAGAGQTAWVVQNGLGGFVAHLINLMLLSVAVNIGQPMMDSAMLEAEPSYQAAGLMAGAAVMYGGLCFIIRNMAQGFINGGPALSGHGGIGGAVMGLIKGGLAGAAFQLTRNHMQDKQKQAALTHQPQGGITSGSGSSGSSAGNLLTGRQWNDAPSPYGTMLKEAKAGYRQAFESNVASTPNLPNGFADQVRADFNKINATAGKRAGDLLRRGYWEQFGFGHAETPKQPVSRTNRPQIKPSNHRSSP